ncbi:hypothetical protein C1645_841452, partial [Glomus cerebriforme]
SDSGHGYVWATTAPNDLQEKLNFYRKKAKVANTERSTKNWYKAKTVKQAVDTINRHLVNISSIRGSNLHNKYEFPDLWTVLHEGLLYRVFFQIATCFACRDGDHYNLRVDQFLPLPDGSLIFWRYRSKNNQRGIESVDLPSGNSGRKTVAQILQDANVPEDVIMGVTGHKSVEGIRAYKEVNPSGSSIVGNSVNNSDVMPEFSSDKKFPIFNNCHFNNVTFKF